MGIIDKIKNILTFGGYNKLQKEKALCEELANEYHTLYAEMKSRRETVNGFLVNAVLAKKTVRSRMS